jgi:RimJ/RimL family protein N-acetyltransferase
VIPLPDPPLADGQVRLRPWRDTDAEALVAAWSDREVIRWTAVPPDPSPEVARRWIAGDTRRRRENLSLDLVVCDDADPGGAHEVCGEVGLAGFRPGSRVAMIGYWAMPHRRGSGMTSAAVDLVATWALGTLELDALVALCDPANPAAVAVAAGRGFVEARVADDGRRILVRRRAAR